jgi:acyl carrier protein
MQDVNFERLISCFEMVFPKLNRNEIAAAAHDTVDGWDSVAQVTLLTLVGEEFGVDIDFEEYEEATSFNSILGMLRLKTANTRP